MPCSASVATTPPKPSGLARPRRPTADQIVKDHHGRMYGRAPRRCPAAPDRQFRSHQAATVMRPPRASVRLPGLRNARGVSFQLAVAAAGGIASWKLTPLGGLPPIGHTHRADGTLETIAARNRFGLIHDGDVKSTYGKVNSGSPHEAFHPLSCCFSRSPECMCRRQ